ncbi:GFA family protein [uncultured Roseobacter sp.]|uniref:GFA family protein n=1 Tax=uncultured Roseobacter sp. TaxID=114847 RepID=UPI00345D502F
MPNGSTPPNRRSSSSLPGPDSTIVSNRFKPQIGARHCQKPYSTGDSGNEKVSGAGSTCGTRIHHAFRVGSDTLGVKGGSVDDISKISPASHIWTKSALP